jgi:hypothetical protein
MQALFRLRMKSMTDSKRTYTDAQREESRARAKAWREANREQHRAYANAYAKAHPDKMKAYRKTRREKLNVYHNSRNRFLRIEAIKHYGGKCACCGETVIEFLQIDHINGGGHKHRKENGNGNSISGWLRKNNYPSGFRILCSNCNWSMGVHGYCPHHTNMTLSTIVEKLNIPLSLRQEI